MKVSHTTLLYSKSIWVLYSLLGTSIPSIVFKKRKGSQDKQTSTVCSNNQTTYQLTEHQVQNNEIQLTQRYTKEKESVLKKLIYISINFQSSFSLLTLDLQ